MTSGFADVDSYTGSQDYGGDYATGFTNPSYSSGWSGGGSGATQETTSGHDYAGPFAPGEGSPGADFASGGGGFGAMAPGLLPEEEDTSGTAS